MHDLIEILSFIHSMYLLTFTDFEMLCAVEKVHWFFPSTCVFSLDRIQKYSHSYQRIYIVFVEHALRNNSVCLSEICLHRERSLEGESDRAYLNTIETQMRL